MTQKHRVGPCSDGSTLADRARHRNQSASRHASLCAFDPPLMKPATLRSLLPLSALAAGCAQGVGIPSAAAAQSAARGRLGERVVAEVAWVPAAWHKVQTENAATGGTSDRYADGDGYQARLGLGNRDQSVGLLHQDFELADGDVETRLQTLLADFDVRIPVAEETGPFGLLVGVGFGLCWLEVDAGEVERSTTGAAQLRLLLTCDPTPWLSFHVGGGGACYGHPGDTEAIGSFMQLGMSASF